MTAVAATHQTRASRWPGLTTQIFIGLLIGILIGWLRPAWGVEIKPLADIFLRMIKMIIAPLVFATLVVGIAGSGDLPLQEGGALFEIAKNVAHFHIPHRSPQIRHGPPKERANQIQSQSGRRSLFKACG